jgi:toxin CcdB
VAQFDVHANAFGKGFLLDCQSDLLSHLNTRLVAPLLRPDDAPKPAGRLNPTFVIDGQPHVMLTQYAAAIEVRELGEAMGSLAGQDREIMNALDVLLTGV